MGIVEMAISKDDILVMEVEEFCFGFFKGQWSVRVLTTSGSHRCSLV